MNQEHPKITRLLARLELLSRRQEAFQVEIQDLRKEILALGATLPEAESSTKASKVVEKPVEKIAENDWSETTDPVLEATAEVKIPERLQPKPSPKPAPKPRPKPKKSNLEKFIGENIILVVGICITVLGVGIGAKYAIDNGWVAPEVRIAFGYFVGIGLLAASMYFRPRYEQYSAGLLAGSMAIMYIVTFMAYNLYDMMPQIVAFILMVIFTIFTVLSAILYNRQLIAVIGLVGAYAVPMLLSDGSGRIEIMFTYMAVINTGVLAVAVQKYWKPLYYSAFGITWFIFLTWLESYQTGQLGLAFTFGTIFFLLFYGTILTYKLLKNEEYIATDVIMLLLNAFIYFGAGLFLFDADSLSQSTLGTFTLTNSGIYMITVFLIYKNNKVDPKLVYLLFGLGVLFATIAVPIQLEGSWITLTWAGMAAILYIVGRLKKVAAFERMSAPLVWITLLALLINWAEFSDFFTNTNALAIFNTNFMVSALVLAAFGAMNFVNYYFWEQVPKGKRDKPLPFSSFWLPAIFIVLLYSTFAFEIFVYWEARIGNGNYHLYNYLYIWLINYTLFFLTMLTLCNVYLVKSKAWAPFNLVLNTMGLLLFLSNGLLFISDLRDFYLLPENSGSSHLILRYLSIGFVVALCFASYRCLKSDLIGTGLQKPAEAVLHITILWLLSSELLSWLDMAGSNAPYKLALSILWGCYSLLVIMLGLYQRKSFLRMGAIALFAVTLIKLFAYDLSALSTISKTIVLVSLGLLLLIISFLYNKYKHLILEEE